MSVTTWAVQLGLLRSKLQDVSSSNYWPDAELMGWVNEGIREIAREVRWHRAGRRYVDGIAGQAVYRLPADVIELETHPRWKGHSLLKFDTDRADDGLGWDWEARLGEPSHYTRNELGEYQLQVYPIPGGGRTTVTSGALNNTTASLSFAVLDGDAFTSEPPWHATVWDADAYPDPADDPNREVILVAAIDGDTLTATRGIGTGIVAHPGTPAIALTEVNGLSYTAITYPTAIVGPGSTVPLPDGGEKALRYYILAEAYEKEQDRRDLQLHAMFAQKYQAELAKLKRKRATDVDTLPARVVLPRGIL